ncbi:hypothetical protein WOC76_01275 [Methylocystis sp. IM3]
MLGAAESYARWILRLLEKKFVELEIVEAAGDSPIGRGEIPPGIVLREAA